MKRVVAVANAGLKAWTQTITHHYNERHRKNPKKADTSFAGLPDHHLLSVIAKSVT
jgi:hypothetical protein